MKKIQFLLVAWALAFSAFVSASKGDEASVNLFYDDLSQYGDWVETPDYGYCWHPNDVGDEWRPYQAGHWAYTDAGWTWLSDEPYGWAVYHYGRWIRLEDTGWVWVPGSEWAPAWVSWRRDPKYVGWAPLPPEARFRRDVGFSGWVDSYYDIGPANYNFVEVRNFGAPDVRTVIVNPRENITIISQTTNITRITYSHDTVFVGGPQYDEISRESSQPIRRLKLERTFNVEGGGAMRGDQMRARVEGDSLRMMAPRININASATPPKVARKIEHATADHGWKSAAGGQQSAEVEKLHAKFKAEAKVPAGLPPKPKFEKLTGNPPGGANASAPAGTPATGSPQTAGTPAISTATSSASPGASGTPARKNGRMKPGEKIPPSASPSASPGASPKGRRNRQTPAPSSMTPPVESTGAAAGANASITPKPEPGRKGKNAKHPMATPGPTVHPQSTPAITNPASTPAPKASKAAERRLETAKPTPHEIPANTPGSRSGKKNTPPPESILHHEGTPPAAMPGANGQPARNTKRTGAPAGEAGERKTGHGKPAESGTSEPVPH